MLKIQNNEKHHNKYAVDISCIYGVVIANHMGIVRQNINTQYDNKNARRPT